MSNELRIFRFAPDQPGKGGHTPGFQTFLGIQDTRQVVGFTSYRRMWWRERSVKEVLSALGAGEIKAVYEWDYYTAGGTSRKTDVVFGRVYDGLGGATSVTMRDGGDLEIYSDVNGTNEPGPITILPVKDRLFMATRQGPGRFWAGARELGVPVKAWRIGVPSPTVAPTLTVSFNYSAGQYYYCGGGGTTIQRPVLTADTTWDDLVAGESVRLTHQDLASPSYVTRKVVSRVSGSTGSNAPASGPFPFAPWGTTGITIECTSSSTSATINYPMPDNGYGTCADLIGLTIIVLGNSRVIDNAVVSGGVTTITTTTAWPAGGLGPAAFRLEGVRVTLDEEVPGQSRPSDATPDNRKLSRPLPGTDYSSWSGVEAPGYAYAYYDPVTGHISNISPITYLPDTDVVNGKVTIDTAPYSGKSAADGTSYVYPGQTPSATGIQYVGGGSDSSMVARFSQIVWFRTRRAGGGAVLFPIGSLVAGDPNYRGTSGNPETQYGPKIDSSTDDILLVSGRIRTPLNTNYPPSYVNVSGTRTELTPRGAAFWDGRLWLFGVPDPGALLFSCDSAQCPMGRPEECFPDENRLVVPAGDGEITALLVCGEHLLVFTARNVYRVAGNHESNYRLLRVAAELGGLTRESVCEVPTDNGAGGMFAAVTADRRVLIVPVDGQATDIGVPISTELAGRASGVVFYRRNGAARIAAVVAAANGERWFYEYNLSTQTWAKCYWTISETESQIADIASVSVATRSGQNTNTFPAAYDSESFLLLGVGSKVYATTATAADAGWSARIQTWSLPGLPAKRRYAFVWAKVVLVGPSGVATVNPPTLKMARDGRSLDRVYTLRAQDQPEREDFPSGEVVDGPYAKTFIVYGQEHVTNAQPIGYRFAFELVTDIEDRVPYAIPYFEVALREVTEDGDLEP